MSAMRSSSPAALSSCLVGRLAGGKKKKKKKKKLKAGGAVENVGSGPGKREDGIGKAGMPWCLTNTQTQL